MNFVTPKEKNDFFKEIEDNECQMQALLVRGYKSLPAARYLLLKIEDEKEAKEYFSFLIDNFITVAKKPADKSLLTENGDPKTAVNIAFTSSGLEKLGISKKTLDTFSRHFIEGMDYCDSNSNLPNERSQLLGDRGNSDPSHWYWGNKCKPVDCLLMLFAENIKSLTDLNLSAYTSPQKGTSVVYTGDTFVYDPKKNLKEHFGFQDGISQPILWGVSKSKLTTIDDDQKIKPGEIVLGMENEYNSYAPSPYENLNTPPSKIDLGENGSYLVFRQIEQHVEKFWKFHYKKSVEDGATQLEKAVKLAAKMVGRWPGGQSLVNCPDSACPIDPKVINNFTYDTPDQYGTKCPLGAHVRRTNPRDQVHTGRGSDDSLIMSRRHRMLRRGRIYGQPLDHDFDVEKMIDLIKNQEPTFDGCNDNDDISIDSKAEPGQTEIIRGLHFICLVSDIGRQFEFVQNVWANTPTFADLRNESDPIIAPKSVVDGLICDEFTTPNSAIRNRYPEVPEFTTVIGGGYFFMPGMEALRHFVKKDIP